jgi:hypothetical protein
LGQPVVNDTAIALFRQSGHEARQCWPTLSLEERATRDGARLERICSEDLTMPDDEVGFVDLDFAHATAKRYLTLPPLGERLQAEQRPLPRGFRVAPKPRGDLRPAFIRDHDELDQLHRDSPELAGDAV